MPIFKKKIRLYDVQVRICVYMSYRLTYILYVTYINVYVSFSKTVDCLSYVNSIG